MSSSLHTTIYRQLLRLGRELDGSVTARAMLIAAPEQLFDRHAQTIISLPQLEGASAEAVEQIASYNTGEFYAPRATQTNSAFRQCVAARATPLRNDRIDVGLSAMRAMGAAVAGASALRGSRPALPWADSEAPLLRRCTEPKVGSLLVTHPVSCLSQQTLHHAVILLVHVNDDVVQGVVVNKPMDVSLETAVMPAFRPLLGPLASAMLYRGGDVAEGQLTVLHEEARLEGSREVAAGLWVSEDFESVREALLKAGGEGGDGAASGGRVKCVAGYAGWHPAQLAAELRRNVWFLAEADADSAAGAASPRTSLAPLAAGSAASARTSLASLALLPGRNGAPQWLRDGLWAGVVAALGGEFEELASFPGDHAAVWKVMREVSEQQERDLNKRLARLRSDDAEC